MGVLIPNNGQPLKNRELEPFKNLGSRRAKREALRFFKKKLQKYMAAKLKQGIFIGNQHQERVEGLVALDQSGTGKES